MLLLMENLNAAWMEDFFNPVCSHLLYVAICMFIHAIYIGSSGDTFSKLSFGAHTMNVRFTPNGYCQPLKEKPLNISIKCKQLLM